MRATSLLLASACACASTPGAQAPPATSAVADTPRIEVAYEGVVDFEGHLAQPGDTTPLSLRWVQRCVAEVCLVERTTGTDERASTARIWSTAEAVWVEGAEHRMGAFAAGHHRRLLTLFAPSEGVPSVELVYPHPRLGRVLDVATYRDMSASGLPGTIEIDVHDADVAWRGTLSAQVPEDAPPLDPPAAPPVQSFSAPDMRELGEGLWDVRIPEHDVRTFVVEFETFLVAIEAPWSSHAGQQVVDLVRGAHPHKPLRYVLYSHHHPHYTGGLRAFMAAGATVVAPSAHASFIRSIADLDFSLEPDALAEAGPFEPAVIAYDDSFTIAEAGVSLQAIDIGERSNHTSAYTMVWLPDSKTLIQGDLGWFVAPGGALRVGGRSQGLLGAIDDHALPVERMVQSWPVNSQEPTIDMAGFRAAIESAR